MNRLLKYILTLLAAGAMYGCTAEYTDYTPGLPDNENNYGVYFPPQSSTTSLEIEADDPQKNITYKIRRTRTEDAITVPVRLDASEEGIFIVPPIRFAEGQRETEFTIQFPRASAGREYTLTITVDDPQYASTYNGNDTALTLTVVCSNWEYIGVGKWRDDILSSVYVNVPNAYAEVDVDIYERRDMPGMFRMEVFNQAYVMKLFNGSMAQDAPGTNTIIDATDSTKVWFPKQDTRLILSSDHGSVIIASNVDKIFSMDESASQYGKLDENGVITFPVQGILAQLANIHASDEWIGANASGKLRIMLPGARLYDYSLTMKRNDGTDGSVGIDITLGQDVETVKYAVVEGRMDDGQASLTAQSLDSGELEFNGTLTKFEPEADSANKTTRLTVKPDLTGLYTLICCSYNHNGQMQDYAFVPFGFVKQGDTKDIALTVGCEQTDELAGKGYDKSNSIKFYAYGKDIYSMRYALRRADKITGNISDEEIVRNYGTDLRASELDSLNNGSFVRTFVRLNGGSTYNLYVQADNGYTNVIRKIEFTTEGQYNPLLDCWTNNDFTYNNPLNITALTSPTWNFYVYDLMDPVSEMKFIGEVTIADNRESTYDDALYITGLLGGLEVDDGRGQDEHGRMNLIPGKDITVMGLYDQYSIYEGIYGKKFGTFSIPGSLSDTDYCATHYGDKIMLIYYQEETLAGYLAVDGMVVGEVYDGYMAFAPNPGFAEQSQTYSFFGLTSYYMPYALYMNMMLVDKSKDLGLPKNPPLLTDILTQMTESSQASSDAASMRNYVETEYDFADYVKRYNEFLNRRKVGNSGFGVDEALTPSVKIVKAETHEESISNGANGERQAEPIRRQLKVQRADKVATAAAHIK